VSPNIGEMATSTIGDRQKQEHVWAFKIMTPTALGVSFLSIYSQPFRPYLYILIIPTVEKNATANFYPCTLPRSAGTNSTTSKSTTSCSPAFQNRHNLESHPTNGH
jgi:hypothetical protein